MKYNIQKLASGLIKITKANGSVNYYTASNKLAALAQGDGIVSIVTETRTEAITPTGWAEIEVEGNSFNTEEELMEALNTLFFLSSSNGGGISVAEVEFTNVPSVTIAHNLGSQNLWAVYVGNQKIDADIVDDGTDATIDFGTNLTGKIIYLTQN